MARKHVFGRGIGFTDGHPGWAVTRGFGTFATVLTGGGIVTRGFATGNPSLLPTRGFGVAITTGIGLGGDEPGRPKRQRRFLLRRDS
jgi:hypothetical protein